MSFLRPGFSHETDSLDRDQRERVEEIEKEIVDTVLQTKGGVDRGKLIEKYAEQNEQGLFATALNVVLGHQYREGRGVGVTTEDGIIERQYDRGNGRIMLCPRDDRETEWRTIGPLNLGLRQNSRGQWISED